MKKNVSLLLALAYALIAAPLVAQVTITNMYVSASTANTATIVWTTSGPATSQLRYGFDASMPFANAVNHDLRTTHSMTLTILQAERFYYFAAVSVDGSGHSTQSGTSNFELCAAHSSSTIPAQGTVNNYYEYGTFIATWIPPTGSSGSPSACGQAFSTTVTGSLSGGASLSASVGDSYKAIPGPGSWHVVVTDAGNLAPISVNAPLSSVSNDISTQLQAQAATAGLTACLSNILTNAVYPAGCGGGSGSGPVIEINGTPISPPSPANFVNTASVTWVFTAGTIQATAIGGGGCSVAIGVIPIGNGSGGCASSPADYNVFATNSFTFQPADNFNIIMHGGPSNNFNVTNDGNINFTPAGDFNVTSATGWQVTNTTSGNMTLANTAPGGLLDLSTQGGRNDSVQGTYNLTANTGMNVTVAGGDLGITAPHFQLSSLFQLFNSTFDGFIEFSNSNILTADAFVYTLARFTGTMMLYTGALTANHCVQVNATANGFVDSGANCGTGGGGSAFNAITSGSNTTATMVVGSGASLSFTGSGVLNASTLGGVALAGLCQTGGTGCPQLAITKAAVSHQFLTSYTSTSGLFTAAQPAFIDISGQATNAQLATQTANTVLGALTATTPSGLAMPSCSGATNALIWTTGTGFGCNTISGGGSSAFSALTSSTNTTAAMVVGAGASLNFTSTGTINASSVGGVALAGLCQTGGTGCPQLAVTKASVSHQFFTSYTSTSGVFTAAQPAFTDISGGLGTAQGPTSLTGMLVDAAGTLSVAASSNVIALWSGTCSSTTFLRGDGSCAAPSGSGNTTSTSLTSNSLPKANGANSIINSLFTDSGTAGAYTGTAGFSTPSMTLTDSVNNGQDTYATGSSGDSTCVLNTTSASYTNCIKAGLPQVSVGPSGPYVPYLIGTFPWSCQPGLGDGLNVVTGGTYLQTTCYNDTGKTVTLTGIKCFTDNNGTSTLAATNGAGTALLTTAVTCTNAFATGTQSATVTIAAGDFIKFTFVADGASKQGTFVATGNHP